MDRRVLRIITLLIVLTLIGVFAWSAWAQTLTPTPDVTPEVTPTVTPTPTAPDPGTDITTLNMPRTITVVGRGSVSVDPDMAVVTLGVQTTGTTVREATDEAAETMEAILDALGEEGIDDADIQTLGYNMRVDRGFGPDRSPDEEATYHVNNNVRVTVRDIDNLEAVLEAAIDAGANAIHGVSFGLAEPEELEAKARELAAENALAKAQALAELHNVEVGPVVSISEVITGGFMPQAFERLDMGGAGGPIMPGELEMSLQLQVVYAIQ